MKYSIFLEMEFFLLVMFSFVLPAGIYGFLLHKKSISRLAVLAFALALIAVSGIDVILLQSLAARAKTTSALLDDQVSIALYLLPLVFAGIGVNLASHVLIKHLDEAEARFQQTLPHTGTPKMDFADRLHTFLPNRQDSASDSREWRVFIAGASFMAVIFMLDLYAASDIRLHVLYIFPLSLIALNCAKQRWTLIALVLMMTFEVITFSAHASSLESFVTDLSVALVAALLTITLAKLARKNHLAALNLASTDGLTNLANCRAFVSSVDSEIARQKRYGGIISLAVLDLDGFKALNDSKGHRAGDEALTLAAEILRAHTRKTDFIGRLGGDEFAVLMPNAPNADCARVCNELCRSIAERMAGAGFAITASIGCKTFVEPPETTSDALHQADEVMYAAKVSGKNCVVTRI